MLMSPMVQVQVQVLEREQVRARALLLELLLETLLVLMSSYSLGSMLEKLLIGTLYQIIALITLNA